MVTMVTKSSTFGGFLQDILFLETTESVMHSWLSCTLYCHVMHSFQQNPPLLVTKTWNSSTFGVFFLKILHFWLRKLEKPPFFFFFLMDFSLKPEKPPLLVVSQYGLFFKTWKTSTFGVFFLQNPPVLVTKTWKTSTFGVFFVSKWIFLQNLHF